MGNDKKSAMARTFSLRILGVYHRGNLRIEGYYAAVVTIFRGEIYRRARRPLGAALRALINIWGGPNRRNDIFMYRATIIKPNIILAAGVSRAQQAR